METTGKAGITVFFSTGMPLPYARGVYCLTVQNFRCGGRTPGTSIEVPNLDTSGIGVIGAEVWFRAWVGLF